MAQSSRAWWQGGALVFAATTLAALLLVAAASGERHQRGNLIVSLDGGVLPRSLPRDRLAPVSVSLAGELRTADRSPLPRLRRVEIALAGRGALDTAGLPACPPRRLRGTDPVDALAACRAALVGRGRLEVSVFLPNQTPFDFHASLRAFNGRRDGRTVLWLHVYGANPPIAFVLLFSIHRRPGSTTLTATVPEDIGDWPHLARFEMTLGRRYSWHGRRRSYLSASCHVPPRFTGGIFPFARATYRLPAGEEVSAAIVRGCRVRG